MKRAKQLFIYGALLSAGIIFGWIIFDGNNDSSLKPSSEATPEKEKKTWTCSMHPQIKQDIPGKCPICGMDLIPLNTVSDDALDFNRIQMSESAQKIADVQTSIVQKSVSGKEIRLTGKVKPDERKMAIITSHVSGRIEKLFVNYSGQEVQFGEKLAKIYSPDLVTAQKELFEAIKFKLTNPEYYQSARNKLKLWLLTEEQIDKIEKSGETMYYFDVISHLSGTVLKRLVLSGDHVETGTMLFEIADLSDIWILFDAYESDLPWIRIGDKVSFEIQSFPGKILSGTVSFIDPVVNPETRVASVRVEINNANKLFKPEMFVRGNIKSRLIAGDNALMVPKSAVLWTGKTAVVYVKDNNKTAPAFEYREILLGEDAGNFYVVKGGLTEGEEIVTNGVFKVDAAAQLEGKKSMMNSESGGQEIKKNENEMIGDHANHQQSSLSFKVFGNCEMCKERIEKAAKTVKGVLTAYWNVDTKIITIKARDENLQAEVISEAIATSGHDTEFNKAPQSAYDELPGCCRYERASK